MMRIFLNLAVLIAMIHALPYDDAKTPFTAMTPDEKDPEVAVAEAQADKTFEKLKKDPHSVPEHPGADTAMEKLKEQVTSLVELVAEVPELKKQVAEQAAEIKMFKQKDRTGGKVPEVPAANLFEEEYVGKPSCWWKFRDAIRVLKKDEEFAEELYAKFLVCLKSKIMPFVTTEKNPNQRNCHGACKIQLERCEGDCDSDDECGPGLKCFERSAWEAVPGCYGVGTRYGWDICALPQFTADRTVWGDGTEDHAWAES